MMPFEGYKKKYFFKKSHFCCTVLFCNYAKMSRVPCWQCYNEKKKKNEKTKPKHNTQHIVYFYSLCPCQWGDLLSSLVT